MGGSTKGPGVSREDASLEKKKKANIGVLFKVMQLSCCVSLTSLSHFVSPTPQVTFCKSVIMRKSGRHHKYIDVSRAFVLTKCAVAQTHNISGPARNRTMCSASTELGDNLVTNLALNRHKVGRFCSVY